MICTNGASTSGMRAFCLFTCVCVRVVCVGCGGCVCGCSHACVVAS